VKLSYEDHGEVSVLTVSGDLTSDQVDALRRACQERWQAGVRHLVLDLEYMTFVDSAGLEALLWIVDEGGERGGQFRLVRPDETIRKILEITRLEKRFDVHETIESAAKSLR
jgi:anti-sigma B factor antagonist